MPDGLMFMVPRDCSHGAVAAVLVAPRSAWHANCSILHAMHKTKPWLRWWSVTLGESSIAWLSSVVGVYGGDAGKLSARASCPLC